MVTAVIAAGGKGTRMGAGMNKVYMKLAGIEIIARTVSVFENSSSIDEIIVVTGENDIDAFREIERRCDFRKVAAVICGGAARSESVYNGLLKASGDIVLIHDGARALITEEEIDAVLADCRKYGAAALGVKCKDTLKIADSGGFIAATADRERTYQIQTPQAFFKDVIISAHRAAEDNTSTDDCALAERMGVRIKITEGSYDNIKLTTPSDIAIGEEILKRRAAK